MTQSNINYCCNDCSFAIDHFDAEDSKDNSLECCVKWLRVGEGATYLISSRFLTHDMINTS